MELKQRISLDDIYAIGLLIVPYGIETVLYFSSLSRSQLLIVPYGIETSKLGYFLLCLTGF